MMEWFLRQLPVVMAAAQAEPGTATVVVTGLSLVFLILLLLIGVILVEGKIFASIEKKKQAKAGQAPTAPVAAPVQQAAAPAPVVEAGVPPEVVAAIVAAVNASSGGGYTLRAVSVKKQGRGAWGLAGVIQSTEPF